MPSGALGIGGAPGCCWKDEEARTPGDPTGLLVSAPLKTEEGAGLASLESSSAKYYFTQQTGKWEDSPALLEPGVGCGGSSTDPCPPCRRVIDSRGSRGKESPALGPLGTLKPRFWVRRGAGRTGVPAGGAPLPLR